MQNIANERRGRFFSKKHIPILALILFLCSCQYYGDFWGTNKKPQDTTPRITSYSILGYPASINGSTISANARWSARTSLVATFTTENVITITIAGVPQVSGVTANDYSAPLTYDLTSADGQAATYTASAITTFPIADSGQALCYNALGTQACGDGLWPGQDADFVSKPRARSFSGPNQYLATSDYTTTDLVTGLVWKTCTEGTTGAACTGTATTFTFTTAATACTALNTANAGAGFAGLTNWRVPSIQELQTLQDYSTYAPSIDTAYFPGQPAIEGYWSSMTYSGSPSNGWFADFGYGTLSNTAKTNSNKLRCVSGTPIGYAAALSDNNDGTITDGVNNLLWQKCQMGQTFSGTCTGTITTDTWQNALSYCNALTWAGRTDWRLPNINELLSIVDFTADTPAINLTYFPTTTVNNYLSSTTNASSPGGMAYVYFEQGIINNQPKSSAYEARCVTDR